MHDATAANEARGRGSRAIAAGKYSFRAASHARDDEILARVLITSWTLLTGRTLRADVPPELISAEELISFWADDQMAASVTPRGVDLPSRAGPLNGHRADRCTGR